jgi:urea transport system ATP-binding protein
MNHPVSLHKPRSILYLNGVTKSFDGFKAINNLSLDIQPGELRAIIGPNGAGKSTMMDIITGKTKPDSGEVRFKDIVDLTRYDEADIANMGIGRKFQKPTVIESLTVWHNLQLARAGRRGVWQALFYRLDAGSRQAIEATLTQVGLADKWDHQAQFLSHGQKQWLEIGMLMMQNPQLLLIDEPAAGMTDYETLETAALLKRISRDHSVVVVEHDMDFIRALDTRVTVLHEGSVLAEGSLEQVSQDARVIDVYLGR